MKSKKRLLVLASVLSSLFTPLLHGQPTNFTYQGQLTESGVPANGIYDFQFVIYNVPTITSPGASALQNSEVMDLEVTNGLFTAAIPFQTWIFNGEQRWLEVQVRTNDSGAYTGLTPWTELTPTPYAVRALTVTSNALDGGYGGVVSFTNPSNTFVGDGSGLVNVTLDGLSSSDLWQLGGNAGTAAGVDFIGTADDEPLEIKVNNERVLHIRHGTLGPTIIGGYSGNFVDASIDGGATIGGGGTWFLGATNRVTGNFGTVSGGAGNSADIDSTVGGGIRNTAVGGYATVSGGWTNTASGTSSAIGGGAFNIANGAYAIVPGGRQNTATDYAFAAGTRAKANHAGAFVWGDSQDADIASTTWDQVTFRAQNGVRLTEDAGSAKTINIGDHYRDNALLAWGKVSSDGTLNADFGVASVTHAGAGDYEIFLTDTAAGIHTLIPVAIAEIDAAPASASAARIVSINQDSTNPNRFKVYINNGNYALVDNDFVFMVTAR
jgi:hypothetical protein